MYTLDDFKEKLETLTMEPSDWSELDRFVREYCADKSLYRKAVVAYQEREHERLPRCAAIFGLCRYYDHGKCSNWRGCPATPFDRSLAGTYGNRREP